MKRKFRQFWALLLTFSIILSGTCTAFADEIVISEGNAVENQVAETEAVQEENVSEAEKYDSVLPGEYLQNVENIQGSEVVSGIDDGGYEALLGGLEEGNVSDDAEAVYQRYWDALRMTEIYSEEELLELMQSDSAEEPVDLESYAEEFNEVQAQLLGEVFCDVCASEEEADCKEDHFHEEAARAAEENSAVEGAPTEVQEERVEALTQEFEEMLSVDLLGASSVCSGAYTKNATKLYNYIKNNGKLNSDNIRYIIKTQTKNSLLYSVQIKATSSSKLDFSMIIAPTSTVTSYPGTMVTFSYYISTHSISSVQATYLHSSSYLVWGTASNFYMSTATGSNTYTYSSVTYSSTAARNVLIGSISTIKSLWTSAINLTMLMDSLMLSEAASLGIGMADLGFSSLDTAKSSGHSFTNYIPNGDGTTTAKCDYCTETDTKTASGSNTIQVINGKPTYCINGVPQTSVTAFVEASGGLWIVVKGVVVTSASGLVQDPNSTSWYFCANGEVQKVTSLVQYDGAWFYVSNGKLNTTLGGFVDYNGGKFFVAAGEIKRGLSGLAQDPQSPSVWYFLSNGEVQNQYTGLCQYDGAWFYVISGRFATEFTGRVEYNGSWFNVVNGEVK